MIEDVFILCFEIEELVVCVEDFLKKYLVKNVLDVCIGSGIIVIVFKKVFFDILVMVFDILVLVFVVVKKNVLLLNVDVCFVEIDLFEVFK